MDEKGLGRRLQDMRRKAGFTQQELCHRANLSFSTLAKIERGAIKSPSIFTIQAIAGALHISLDELVGLTSPAEANRKYHTSKTGVKFVYFDINGSLIRFYQRASASLAAAHGLAAGLVENTILYYDSIACRGEMTLDDFNKAVADRLGIPEIDWATFYFDSVEPIPIMQQALAWTAEHYRVGLLTNLMPTLLEGLLERGKIPTLPYDVIVNSSAIGMIKPDPAIYTYATEQAGVAPSEILFIDDIQANLVPAERQGWQTAWFDYARPEESTQRLLDTLELAV